MSMNNPNPIVQQYPIQNQMLQLQQSQLQLQQQMQQQQQQQQLQQQGQQQSQQIHNNQVQLQQLQQLQQQNPQITLSQMQYLQVPIQAQSQHQNQHLTQTQLSIQQQIQRLQLQKDNLSSNNNQLENQLQQQLQFQIMQLKKLQSQLHMNSVPNNISSNGISPLQQQQILLHEQQQQLQQQQQYPQLQQNLAHQLSPLQLQMIQQSQQQAQQQAQQAHQQAQQHERQNQQQSQNQMNHAQLQAELQLQTEMLRRAQQQQDQEFSQVQQQTHVLAQTPSQAQAQIQYQIQAQALRQAELLTHLQSQQKVNSKEKIRRSRNHPNLEAVANNHSSKDKISEKALQQQIINNINENLMSTIDQPGYIDENEIVHDNGLLHNGMITDIDHYENFDNVLDYAETVSPNVENISKPQLTGDNNTDAMMNLASMSNSHHSDEDLLKLLEEPFDENMEIDHNKIDNNGSENVYTQKEEEDILDFLKLMDDPAQLGTQGTDQLQPNTNSNHLLNSEANKLGNDVGLGISMSHESLDANIETQLHDNFMTDINELGQEISNKQSRQNENNHLNSIEVPLTPLNDLYLPSASPTPISNSMPTLLRDLPASGKNSHNNSITTFDERNALMGIIGHGNSNAVIDMSTASSILIPPPTPTSLHNNFRTISPKRSVASLRSFTDDYSPEYSSNLQFLEDFEIDEVEIEGHDSKVRKKCDSFTNSSKKLVPKLRKSQSMNAIGLSNKSLRNSDILKSPINTNHGPATPKSPARLIQTGKSNVTLTTSPVVISSYHQPLSSLATRRQSNVSNTLKSKSSVKKLSLATASANVASTSSALNSTRKAKDLQAKKNIATVAAAATSNDNSRTTKTKNLNPSKQLARAAATAAASLSQGSSQNNHVRKTTITAAAAAALSRSTNKVSSKSSSTSAASAMNSSNSLSSSHPISVSGKISVGNNVSKSNSKSNTIAFNEASSAKSMTSQAESLKSMSSSISSCSSNSSNSNKGHRKFIAFDSESKKSLNGKLKKEMNVTSTVTTISSKGNLKPTRIISTSIKQPTKAAKSVKSTSNSVKLPSSTNTNSKSNYNSIAFTTSTSSPSLSVASNGTHSNRSLSVSQNPPTTTARNSISSTGSNRSSNDSLLTTPTFNGNSKFNSLNFIAENMGSKTNKFQNQTPPNKAKLSSSTNNTTAPGSNSSNGGFSVFNSSSPQVDGNVFSSDFDMESNKSVILGSPMGAHGSNSYASGSNLTPKSNSSLNNGNANFSTFITEPIQIKIRKEREEKLKLQQEREERKNSVSVKDEKGQNSMVDKKLSSPSLTNTFTSVSSSSPNSESPNHKYTGKQFEFCHKFVNQSIKSNKSISLSSPNLAFSSNFSSNNNKPKHSASGSNSSINSTGSTGTPFSTGNNINHTMFKKNYTLSGGHDNLKGPDIPDDARGSTESSNSVTSSPPLKQVPKTNTGSPYHQMKQNSEFMNSITKFPKEKSSVVPKLYHNINQGLMEFQLDVPNSKK